MIFYTLKKRRFPTQYGWRKSDLNKCDNYFRISWQNDLVIARTKLSSSWMSAGVTYVVGSGTSDRRPIKNWLALADINWLSFQAERLAYVSDYLPRWQTEVVVTISIVSNFLRKTVSIFISSDCRHWERKVWYTDDLWSVGKRQDKAAYTLNVEVLRSSETSEVIDKSAWHDIPEDLRLHGEFFGFSYRNRFFFRIYKKQPKFLNKVFLWVNIKEVAAPV